MLSMGLLNLDAVLGGLRPGEVVCIAGTSRSGRRSLACQIGLSAAKQGAAVLVVSTETSARQIALRYLAADARVDLSELDAGRLDEGGWRRVVDAAGAISGLDLRVCGNRDVSLDDVSGLAEDALGGRDKGLVVLCGVGQIAEVCGRDSGCVVERMKALAVELGVTVVATVNVPEGVVRGVRKGGYDPSDIGEAIGGVEDGRDALLFLDRSVTTEEGARADAPDFGTAVVAVGKNRFGGRGLSGSRSCGSTGASWTSWTASERRNEAASAAASMGRQSASAAAAPRLCLPHLPAIGDAVRGQPGQRSSPQAGACGLRPNLDDAARGGTDGRRGNENPFQTSLAARHRGRNGISGRSCSP